MAAHRHSERMSAALPRPRVLPLAGEATLTITEHYGALEHGQHAAATTTVLEQLDVGTAGELARIILGRPPSMPAPARGTHRRPVAGGVVTVSIGLSGAAPRAGEQR